MTEEVQLKMIADIRNNEINNLEENLTRIRIKNIKYHFKDYCSSTSIHGFKYFGEKRTRLEKSWWFVNLLMCIILCGLMIYLILRKYLDSPITITFSSKETPIYEIPFPAVTICPMSKISNDYANYTEVIERLIKNETFSDNLEEAVELATVICQNEFYFFKQLYKERQNNIYDFLNQSKPDFFMYCSYMGKFEKCADLFTPIITDEGLCYSFNVMDRSEIFKDDVFQYENFHKQNISDWNVEKGYVSAPIYAFPRRALHSGAQNSLFIIMGTKIEDHATCLEDENEGYKVSLHLPARVPRVTADYFNVPLNQVVMASILPQYILTPDSIKSYDPMKRDCFFPSERQLKYFKIYTQGNCHMECLTNASLKLCGCSAFYMPRYNTTPICGTKDIDCMNENELDFMTGDIYQSIQGQENVKHDDGCNCMKICTNIYYNLELSQNTWRYHKKYKLLHMLDEDDMEYEYSSLTLFFKTNHVETKQRNEMYGFTDFLSNFGGLLGLFTGFSILSLMEIFYFMSLRIIGNIRLYGNWVRKDL